MRMKKGRNLHFNFLLPSYFPLDAWRAFQNIKWSGRYVKKDEDEALVWISFESKKRGSGSHVVNGPGPVVLVHAGTSKIIIKKEA
jgi:hypothetical protein